MRRGAAAVLAALTVAGSLHLVLNRPAPQDVPIVVAVHQLAIGDEVGSKDVEVLLVPARAQPPSALVDPAQAHGQLLVRPVGPGETLTQGALRTTGLLAGLPEGMVAVFLPLENSDVVTATRPGDRVDAHSPIDGSIVVHDSLVLRASGADSTGLWLALDSESAQSLAAARGADPAGGSMQVALRPPST